jgi:phosphoribosyl-AMP cyclohydrolase
MIKFKCDENGLMPAIVQDHKSREVLMLAYVNKQAFKKMLAVGKTCFYSRSRKTYWIKGESSGHIQRIKNITTDCDRDTLLIQVEQKGGACHLGYRTCFVHLLDKKGNMKKVTQKKVFDPSKVY